MGSPYGCNACFLHCFHLSICTHETCFATLVQLVIVYMAHRMEQHVHVRSLHNVQM